MYSQGKHYSPRKTNARPCLIGFIATFLYTEGSQTVYKEIVWIKIQIHLNIVLKCLIIHYSVFESVLIKYQGNYGGIVVKLYL